MNLKRFWHREYFGDRIAWKIGDLTGEDCYHHPYGQFSIDLDFNVDSGTFKTFEHNPFRTVAQYVDHSFSVMFWRWGLWVAVRGKEL